MASVGDNRNLTDNNAEAVESCQLKLNDAVTWTDNMNPLVAVTMEDLGVERGTAGTVVGFSASEVRVRFANCDEVLELQESDVTKITERGYPGKDGRSTNKDFVADEPTKRLSNDFNEPPQQQAMCKKHGGEAIATHDLQGWWVGLAVGCFPWVGSLRKIDDDNYIRDLQCCLIVPLCGRVYRRSGENPNLFQWTEDANTDWELMKSSRCAVAAPGISFLCKLF